MLLWVFPSLELKVCPIFVDMGADNVVLIGLRVLQYSEIGTHSIFWHGLRSGSIIKLTCSHVFYSFLASSLHKYHSNAPFVIKAGASPRRNKLTVRDLMSQTLRSQRYGFRPLELQPFTRLDVDGLGIEEVKLSEPDWDSRSTEKARSSTTNFSVPFNDQSTSSSNYRNIGSDEQILPSYQRTQWPFTTGESTDFVPTSLIQRKSRRLAMTWIVAIMAIIAAAFSTFYSYRVLVNHAALPDSLVLSPGATVLVVNIMSHVVAYLCWFLFSNTIEALRWALACRKEGVLLTSFLAMSRATPLMGVLYLCITKGKHQIWAFQRYGSFILEKGP